MLGSAETIGQHTDLFSIPDKKHRIYRKKTGEASREVDFSLPYLRPYVSRRQAAAEEVRGPDSIQSEANRLVLDRYSPPGVIVDDDMRIVQFRGQTGRFLEPASGDASLNLLKMCREGLLHGLRTALQMAKKKDGPVRREGVRVKTNGDFVDVTLEVVPITPLGDARHYLILFCEASPVAPKPKLAIRGGRGKAASAKEDPEELDRLQKELVASREYLQSVIQDLEAANEELQSANEEILSSNEELQSTNEELDTAKEELQSTNEELNTVNEELHGRNDELALINSDLLNLLNGVQIAIVIVARDLRIRRFTPMAERVLNLIAGDVGRPIGNIKPNINCPELEQMIHEVIDTIAVQQREVQDTAGRTYSLTIRPYQSVDNRIDGAVLALFDIHEARSQASAAQEARDFADAVFDSVRQPLIVLTADWKVQQVNAAFSAMFQVPANEAEGVPLFELSGGAWDAAPLRTALERAATEGPLDGVTIEADIPGIGRQRLLVSGRALPREDGKSRLWVLAIERA
jgi:two-component system CheB/CheR fusion protein